MRLDGELVCKHLRAKFPECSPRLEVFPSGSYMIDFSVNEETFVIEFVIGHGTGISKQKDTVFGWEGVQRIVETIQDVDDFVKTTIS